MGGFGDRTINPDAIAWPWCQGNRMNGYQPKSAEQLMAIRMKWTLCQPLRAFFMIPSKKPTSREDVVSLWICELWVNSS